MIRVRQVKVPILESDKLLSKIASKIRVDKSFILDFNIIKRSIDARDKSNILYVYEVNVSLANEDKVLKKNKSVDILKSPSLEYKYNITGKDKLLSRPIVVGSGPSGLFCAYFLAEAGFRPIVLERGEKVEDRVLSVEKFFNSNKLNTSSNVQFGEGGAGTFSDGKLNTLVKDKFNRGRKVFEIFVENGAPSEIMYDAHPHIGTDILRNVIKNIREKIISMGGEFRYNSCVTDNYWSTSK